MVTPARAVTSSPPLAVRERHTWSSLFGDAPMQTDLPRHARERRSGATIDLDDPPFIVHHLHAGAPPAARISAWDLRVRVIYEDDRGGKCH